MNNEVRLEEFFSSLTAALNGRDTPATHRLSVRMRKRARISRKGLNAKAENLFIANNTFVGERKLSLDPWIVNNARLFITTSLEKFTHGLDPQSIQNTLDPYYLYDHWRFGPGASSDVFGTHICQKIVQVMTITERCEPYVKYLRGSNAYFRSYDTSLRQTGYRLLRGSVLGFVPKNEETVRTIATEPSGNMALQLAAGHYLEETLRCIGLDIRTQQERNKVLARLGSEDGSYATIDLKSASDLIGRDLVSLLMPDKWVKLLEDLRSPHIRLSNGSYMELNMMSTMGNGFTFPLMTLIITALVYAVQCQDQGRPLWVDWDRNAVFGDDIIVPTAYAEETMNVLEQAGFIVNRDKSFISGPFRESCGGDYYEGVDITPFYVKSLKCDADVYVAINQLTLWCAKNCIHLWEPLIYLLGLLKDPLFVPEWHGPSEGILTSQVSRKYRFLKTCAPKWVHRPGHFDMPLAIYGGLETNRLSVEELRDWDSFSQSKKAKLLGRLAQYTFTPRPSDKPGYRVKYVVQEGRLPQGFLDGSDPISRGGFSHWIAQYIAIAVG